MFTEKTKAILILLHMLVFVFGLPIAHKLQNLPFVSAKTVFGEYSNFSDWGLPVAIPYSWFGALWVNSGWVVPVYVTEETHNARIEIPKSLYYTFTTNTVCGLVICLISAFCINDMEAAAASEKYVLELCFLFLYMCSF